MKKILLVSYFLAILALLFIIFPKSNSFAIVCTYQTGTYSKTFSCSRTVTSCPGGACTSCSYDICYAAGCLDCSAGIFSSCNKDLRTGISTQTCSSYGARCPSYTSYNCPSTQCQGTTYYSGVSCSGDPSLPCHYSTVVPNSPLCTGGTCTAGTGSTPASCGGHAYYACTSTSPAPNGTCCDFTYRCSGSSCIAACHVGVSVSFCGGTCGGAVTPNCNSGLSCGACTLASGTCGTGSQTCTYTTYTGGGSCTPAPAPNQSCTVGCPLGQTCSGGTCVSSTYSISGNIYNDSNGNGAKDTGEGNYSGATVGLSTGATTTTDTNGNYSFSSLNSGGYIVTLTAPSGYTPTTTNPVSTSVGPNTTVNFGMLPPYTISGNVFVDANKDMLKNAGESNYTGSITITSSGAGATITYPSSGAYNVAVQPGSYTISYTSVPSGYIITYPVNGPPPSFNVTVGGSCNASSSNSASCDANGNITNLNFGISNSIPWIQAKSGDITGNNISNPGGGGLINPVASGATCGGATNYASITGGGGTPGIINAGAGSYNFCPPNICQNLASQTQWVVGGLSDVYTYDPATPGIIKTSYSYISSVANQSGITPTPLGTTQCGAGGIANCQLSPTLTHGIYIANGDLTLTGSSYTFPANQNYVILVKGKLFIKTKILVPVGSSTAFFTAADDIHVDKSVGEATITSTVSDVEGYYSTDKSFYVDGNNACPTPDLRLNMAGAVVVNASLQGGSFNYTRDLCGGNLSCPVFYISERPDFILNSPFLIMDPRRVWQEIAP